MDSLLILGFTRGIERLAAVVIGGLAIYFGYRLFLLVPHENDAKGQIKLPGFSVVISKAGPGALFAAFGAAVLVFSFMKPVSLKDVARQSDGSVVERSITGMGPLFQSAASTTEGAVDADGSRTVALANARLSIQVLNCLKRTGRLPEIGIEAAEVEVAVRNAKMALLLPVWAKGWVEPGAFAEWARVQSESHSGEPYDLFSAVHPGCGIP